MDAIFLSASVPTPDREGYDTADPYLIREAVSALVEVVLGRFTLVWGGQPAITPMIWEAARKYGTSYASSVHLYQSEFFRGAYPSENNEFENVTVVESVGADRNASLTAMRKKMFDNYRYHAAVFIGGMEGIHEEYRLFSQMHPNAKIIATPSPGGVAREIYRQQGANPDQFEHAIDYSFWYYKLLEVDGRQKRN